MFALAVEGNRYLTYHGPSRMPLNTKQTMAAAFLHPVELIRASIKVRRLANESPCSSYITYKRTLFLRISGIDLRKGFHIPHTLGSVLYRKRHLASCATDESTCMMDDLHSSLTDAPFN